MNYHYLNPVYADLMRVNFGMEFTYPAENEENQDWAKGMSISHLQEYFLFAPPYKVAESSLHILIPQVGDIMLNPDGEPAIVVADVGPRNPHIVTVGLSMARQFAREDMATIAIRAGKAFIWPCSHSE